MPSDKTITTADDEMDRIYMKAYSAGYRDAINDAANTAEQAGRSISKGSHRVGGPEGQGEFTANAIRQLKP